MPLLFYLFFVLLNLGNFTLPPFFLCLPTHRSFLSLWVRQTLFIQVRSGPPAGALTSRWRQPSFLHWLFSNPQPGGTSHLGSGPPCLSGMFCWYLSRAHPSCFYLHSYGSHRFGLVVQLPISWLHGPAISLLIWNSSASWSPSLTDVTFAASLTSIILKLWARWRQSFHFVLENVKIF